MMTNAEREAIARDLYDRARNLLAQRAAHGSTAFVIVLVDVPPNRPCFGDVVIATNVDDPASVRELLQVVTRGTADRVVKIPGTH